MLLSYDFPRKDGRAVDEQQKPELADLQSIEEAVRSEISHLQSNLISLLSIAFNSGRIAGVDAVSGFHERAQAAQRELIEEYQRRLSAGE